MLVKLNSVALATGELQHDVNYYVKTDAGVVTFLIVQTDTKCI